MAEPNAGAALPPVEGVIEEMPAYLRNLEGGGYSTTHPFNMFFLLTADII